MRTNSLNILIPVLLLIIIGCRQPQPQPSVLGIEFGSTYNQTWQLLTDWYGTDKTKKIDRSIFVDDISLGHLEFTSAIFFFQYKGQKSYLHKIVFFKSFSDDSIGASSFEKELMELIKDKYNVLTKCKGNDGEQRYKFGVNPKNEEEPLGFLGRDGNSVFIVFGPIYYLPKSSDF